MQIRGSAPIEVIVRPFQRFARQEAAGGIVLFLATVFAFVWANSPWADSYFAYWQGTLDIGAGRFRTSHSIHHWINDGLMTVFFFVMGMEIKREFLVGELRSPRAAALPIAAAFGGVLTPALIFLALTYGGPESRGWAIPTATDIAFSLGVLALLSSRIPPALKVFLAALAIVDDIIAVLVIALFYSGDLSVAALVSAALWYAAAWGLNALGIRNAMAYTVVGIGLWLSVLSSGVHGTIAGVLLASAIPSRSRLDSDGFVAEARQNLDSFASSVEPQTRLIRSPEALESLHRLQVRCAQMQAPLLSFEHALHKLVSFGIMPLFALANAGVRVLGDEQPNLLQPAAVGTGLGLLLGKPIGVMLFSWLAVRLRIGALPDGVSWRQLHGAGWLAGIGFTMALFVAELAFGQGKLLDATKGAIVLASVLAGLTGSILLIQCRKRDASKNDAF